MADDVQLLVDDFALNGYKTIAPDILAGEPIHPDSLNSTGFDWQAWLARHDEASWVPVVDGVVAALKESGVKRIGTTSYCFGAPPAFKLAFANESHATVLAHPSRLKVPDDLEVSVGIIDVCVGSSFTGNGVIEISGHIEGASLDQQL